VEAARDLGPQDWPTPAEQCEYRTTPSYPETLEFLRRLERAYPAKVRIETFGKSGEGRDLALVVCSRDGDFDPPSIRASGRAILLVQNAIHAGEMDGKDACLALLRDLLVRPDAAALLDRVVLLFIPVYNVDGHERRSPYNRINQNGPEEMGWRANATNLNLNRDYLKAQAPETRSFLRMFHRWLPDFFVDNHVTDGADFEYDVTFRLDATPDVFAPTADWIRESVTPDLVRHVNASGHLAFPSTVFLVDDGDPSKGLAMEDNPPRFSTGQMILENRPGLLVELHMLKEYRTRVGADYAILRAVLEVLNRDADVLATLNRDADRQAASLGSGSASVPLTLGWSGETTSTEFRGRGFRRFASEITGANAARYGPGSWNGPIPMQTGAKVVTSAVPPAGYIIPPQWTEVIDVLLAHDVVIHRTSSEWTGEVDQYLCSGMEWPDRPFEGRFPILRSGNVESAMGRFGRCELAAASVRYPAGSAVVPLRQRLSKVAIHWLEPEAPDSALRWGFFASIFEQKESSESYVVEQLASRVLEEDPAARAEFNARLGSDPSFASSPKDRLQFFYARSAWGRANRIGEYPVGRLRSLEGLPIA
jgi:hypothetical protein